MGTIPSLEPPLDQGCDWSMHLVEMELPALLPSMLKELPEYVPTELSPLLPTDLSSDSSSWALDELEEEALLDSREEPCLDDALALP